MTDMPLLETPKQLTTRSGLSEGQIRQLIKTGQLQHVRVGCRILIPTGALEKFVAEGTQESWAGGIKDHDFAIFKSVTHSTSPGPSAVAAASARLVRQTANELKRSSRNSSSSEVATPAQVIQLGSS
jgi:hypothetical protein